MILTLSDQSGEQAWAKAKKNYNSTLNSVKIQLNHSVVSIFYFHNGISTLEREHKGCHIHSMENKFCVSINLKTINK